jgi:hypothetical protein
MNGTRFQRGHLYEAFGSFHVEFYQTEVVDLVLVRPDRMFPEREDIWKWPIREISEQKSSALSHPSSLRVGRYVSEWPTGTDVEEATACGHAGMIAVAQPCKL